MTILVTGGRGYLGGLVAGRYGQMGHEILAPGRAQVDLSGPDPFVSVSDAERSRITHLVHAAAVTRFDVDRATAQAVNVEGTAKVVAFARRCPHLESLGLVSTVYATGLRGGAITERLYDGDAGFANSYEWSKGQAEQLMAAAAGDLPWRILRVATVVADDPSGAVTQHNAFHDTLKLWFHGLLPLVPGDARTRLYLVTGNFVVDAVVRLMGAAEASGVYHLAHEAAESLTLEAALDVVAERFESVEGFRRRGVLRPLLGDEESFELLAAGVSTFGGGMVRQSLQSVVPFARQLFVDKELDNLRLRQVLGPSYRAPDAAELVRRTCDNLVATRWGRHAVA